MRRGASTPTPTPPSPPAAPMRRRGAHLRGSPHASVFAQAVSESVDGVCAVDREGRVTFWNGAMERLLGLCAADVLGQVAWELLPFCHDPDEDQLFRAMLAGERTATPEQPFHVIQTGRAGVMEVRYAAVREASGAVSGGLAIVRDVSARQQADEARQRAERAADRSRRLQALTAALSEAATVEQVADVIVFKGMEAIGADAGSLALISDDAQGEPRFEIVRTSGFPTDVVSRYRFFPVVPGRPLSDAVREQKPVLLASAAEWAERYATVAFETTYPAFEAFAGIPIVSRGRLLAGVSFSFRAAQEFDDGVRTFLGTLGEQCAQALERAGLFEAERAAREAAEQARAEAEAASRAKGEFLATMSHELRTPLNAIAGYTDLLLMELHGPLTDAQRADLERLQRSQRHLLALVQDVLDVATLDSGGIHYELADVPVHAVLDEARAVIAAQLASKGIRFDVTPCELALRVRADAGKLRQIVRILLSNAVKFTAAGGHVTLSARACGDSVAIVVRDTGRGIPHDQHEAIFAPFVQLDRGYTRTAEGTGLGLAIARELARGMGGEVSVESEAGQGARFTVLVPTA